MNISGVNRIRVLILAGCVLVIILYFRFFMEDAGGLEVNCSHALISLSHYEIPILNLFQAPLYIPTASSPVLVTVFYETLCPDSKHFVNKQLEPTYAKAGAFMDIKYVPYGKATVNR